MKCMDFNITERMFEWILMRIEERPIDYRSLYIDMHYGFIYIVYIEKYSETSELCIIL